MKKLLLLPIALIFGLGVASPAHAAGSVTVDFPDGVLSQDCAGVPVNVTVTGTATEVRFEATVTLHDPAGDRDEFSGSPDFLDFDELFEPANVAGSVPAGGGSRTKTAKPEACAFEAEGQWRADVIVQLFDSDDNVVETVTGSDTANLRSPKSFTTLSRSPKNDALLIHVDVETPEGGVEPCHYCRTKLQVRSHARWKTILLKTTRENGDAGTDIGPKKKVSYRAVTPAFGTTRSESAIFRRR